MKKWVIGALALALGNTANAERLSCEILANAGAASTSDYFTEIEKADPIEGALSEKLLRKSVAAFYFRTYSSALSLKEVDELGEGVSVSRVIGKNGKSYISVNVGFGGGNSATYFYLPDSLSFVPVMGYDGECINQGQAEEFPIETHVDVERRAGLVCDFGDDAPFGEVNIQIPLGHDGLMFGSSANLALGSPHPIVRRLAIETPKSKEVEVSYSKESDYLTFHTEAKAKKGTTDWTVTVSGRLGGKEANISGRAYPQIQGGYHSERAREYFAVGSCVGALRIKKVEFHRVVNF